MIRFKNVSFEYEKGWPVLQNLSFDINDGEAVGLIGANGAGKSTLMKVLLGLLPCSGTVLVDDLAVNKQNLKEIRRKLGFVFQNSDNQMFMPTVYEDIMFAQLNYGLPKEEAEAITDRVLSQLGSSGLKNRFNHKLSGGEKRMAAIAAVLAMAPEVLLMDEPTSTLDPYNRRTVINTINSLPNTKLIASHDLDMILDTCRRVLLLSGGSVVADGNAEEVLRNTALLEANRLELPLCFSER